MLKTPLVQRHCTMGQRKSCQNVDRRFFRWKQEIIRLGWRDAMQIEGPERYELTFTPETFTALCAKGTNKFSGLSIAELPKLYIASIDDKPIYVGMTKQSIRTRLRFGWNAKGKGGYHGYAWRHGNSSAVLDVWCHIDAIDR